MKIGILTYHKAHNYGAVLQALATRIVLEGMGHEVYYIDYWPSYHKDAYKFFSWARFRKQKLGYLKNRLLLWKEIASRIHHFNVDINKYIQPYCKSFLSKEKYDVVVYGSDQIWRKQFSTGRINPVYYGDNLIESSMRVTYAASMGVLIEDIDTKNKVKNWLGGFDHISVREKDLQQYLSEIGIKSQLVLDPTLLVGKAEWDKIVPEKPLVEQGYVLFYSLNPGAFDTEAIRDFSKKHDLHFVEVKGTAGKDNDNSISQCGPLEFVSLIKNADYVFSTSYHGLLFSIIYHKNFFTSFTSNAGRAESILKITGLENRMLKPLQDTIPELEMIDYTIVDNKLSSLKASSLSYLKQATSYE